MVVLDTTEDMGSTTYNGWYNVAPWYETSPATAGTTWVVPVMVHVPADPIPLPYIELFPLPGRARIKTLAGSARDTARRSPHTRPTIRRRQHSRGRGGWCGHTRRRP